MPEEIVTLWRYRDLSEALVAKAKLQSEALRCSLADDNIVRLNWFLSNAIGGVRLQVVDVDAEAAMELLAEAIPPSFSAEETGEEYVQPECPNCHELDTSYETFYRGVTLWALWLWSLPFWIPRLKRWKCEACGNRWKARYE